MLEETNKTGINPHRNPSSPGVATGGLIAGYDHPNDDGKTVSVNEITSLAALIAYVAHTSGRSDARVERSVADRFNVPNVRCLPSSQFDSAIRYLVDSL
jgi:hypothetical protein